MQGTVVGVECASLPFHFIALNHIFERNIIRESIGVRTGGSHQHDDVILCFVIRGCTVVEDLCCEQHL